MVRQHRTDVLFEFDTLFDLQIGTVKALQKDFLSGGFNPHINFSFLENETEETLKVHRVYDLEESIISQSLLGEAKQSASSIFSDYLREDYNRIIELSPITHMVRLIKMYAKTSIIHPYIICKNEVEERWVREITSNLGNIIRVDTEKEIDLSNYAKLFLSNIHDILGFKHVECITISVLNYGQNFTLIEEAEDRVLLPHIVIMLSDINQFEVIEPYNIQKVYG